MLMFKQVPANRQINKPGIVVVSNSCKTRVVARLCGFLNFLTIAPGFLLLRSFFNNKLFGSVRGGICSFVCRPLYLEVFERSWLSWLKIATPDTLSLSMSSSLKLRNVIMLRETRYDYFEKVRSLLFSLDGLGEFLCKYI